MLSNSPGSVGAQLSQSPCKGLASFLLIELLSLSQRAQSAWLTVWVKMCLGLCLLSCKSRPPPKLNCPRQVTTGCLAKEWRGIPPLPKPPASQQARVSSTAQQPLLPCVTCFQKLHNFPLGLIWMQHFGPSLSYFDESCWLFSIHVSTQQDTTSPLRQPPPS